MPVINLPCNLDLLHLFIDRLTPEISPRDIVNLQRFVGCLEQPDSKLVRGLPILTLEFLDDPVAFAYRVRHPLFKGRFFSSSIGKIILRNLYWNGLLQILELHPTR